MLVPVFYGDHAHHGASLDLFVRLRPGDGCCAAHSLAEVYSTLTRMPGKHRISGDQAMLFVGNVRERLTIVAMDENDYVEALTSAARAGIFGGTTYDALLAHCAAKVGVETIYTWNPRRYRLCGESVERRLKKPVIGQGRPEHGSNRTTPPHPHGTQDRT